MSKSFALVKKMSRFISWLACLGTPKAGPVVYCSPSINDYKRLVGYSSWVELARSRVDTFSLTKEEYDVRELWMNMLDAAPYCLRKLKQLPKHFKIGSVVFLWDNVDPKDNMFFDSYTYSWYIKSYIDGCPELDNGDCTISQTKFYNSDSVSTRYDVTNSDLFTYIMNNLDKVVAQ